MKRLGTHRPTIEDLVELSGIETLHPGGMALTRRTGEVAGLAPGLAVLDVSSGRGTQAIFYAQTFGVSVTGVDLSPEMNAAARAAATAARVTDRVRFVDGDSQALPFPAAAFDVVVNECAVGIPDDSQRVLDEMVRVTRPGGAIVIHETIWGAPLTVAEKAELAERYGTTPLEAAEWRAMLERAGVRDVREEIDPWSRPENFWKTRKDRDVRRPSQVLTPRERLRTVARVARRHGLGGLRRAFQNERRFFRAVHAGQLGYGLFWGRTPAG